VPLVFPKRLSKKLDRDEMEEEEEKVSPLLHQNHKKRKLSFGKKKIENITCHRQTISGMNTWSINP